MRSRAKAVQYRSYFGLSRVCFRWSLTWLASGKGAKQKTQSFHSRGDLMADRQIKILWLIESICGGAGAVLLSLVTGLASMRHCVVVNANAPQLGQGMDAALGAKKIEIISVSSDPSGAALMQLAFARFGPDLVICHWWKQ